MPTGASGFMPRRSSYASVVSGAAVGSPHQYSQVMRSGAFAHLAHSELDPSYDFTSYHNLSGHSRHDSRGYDMDFNTNGGTHGRSGSWARGGQLPSFSSAFGPLVNGYGYAGLGGGHVDQFFTPSYLKGSKYVQRLEDAHRAKVAAHKDGHSTHSSQPGSLSTSASSINLHTKIAPSHRGMTYDLIEKAPPIEDEMLAPLPSRWNSQDKYGGLEVLSDGQEIKFTGPKSDRDRDLEACAIRADHPMPPQCGIYYFEVTIISRKREESSIGIGFSSKNVPLSRLPGWEPESWAYHGDDGHSFCCNSSGKHYGPPFNAGDIIGCGINFRSNSAFFTKNGDHLGLELRKKPKNVNSMTDYEIQQERKQIRQQIEMTNTVKLAPPLSETDLIQSLVLQFLSHDGYVETARAFAAEVHSEKKALSLDPNAIIEGVDVKEDEDASHRQPVLEGDVDKALKHTNAFYPNVLKDNEHVSFRLKCRKFIEMIRQGAEMQNSSHSNGVKKSNGHSGDWYDDVTQGMDLDDHQSQANNWDRMETEESSENQNDYHRLVQETLAYGQALQAEYKDDPRREISKALEEAFALMAYTDPLNAKEVSHQLDPSGRAAVAEELNSAILLSLGKSSTAALEKLIQQSTVLLEELGEAGGPGAFVSIDDFVKIRPTNEL
ncbi:CTLH/CRA C-terminal to lish motif domain-containing protein [Rhexocercosporidium sp. MPI-PUGE-AT-0058]|nr:CTLH/CRA C-terminal to lish motif domain-containing protein [Rhexocercosporidium sp. MPI-PUGE-AT-0058]